jgi:hypothetical protein
MDIYVDIQLKVPKIVIMSSASKNINAKLSKCKFYVIHNVRIFIPRRLTRHTSHTIAGPDIFGS